MVRRGSRMSIQSDPWMREQSLSHRTIEPFREKQVADGISSYGLSFHGRDVRVSSKFKLFTNVNRAMIVSKVFDERSFVPVQADAVLRLRIRLHWLAPWNIFVSPGMY